MMMVVLVAYDSTYYSFEVAGMMVVPDSKEY
jgi:hypothetical protein